MSEAAVTAVRLWAIKARYPDLNDLQRIDTVGRNFPVRSINFLRWLTSLSSENSLITLGLTADQFDSIGKSDAGNYISQFDGSDISSEADDREGDEESIDELNGQLMLIEKASFRLQKQIHHIEAKLMKAEAETIPKCMTRNGEKLGQEKHLLDAKILVSSVDDKSATILNLPLTFGEKFNKLQLMTNEIVEIESNILRNIALTSASYFYDNRNAPLQSDIDIEGRDFPSKAERMHSLAIAANSSEALEVYEEARKESEIRLQETRLKVLESFHSSTIQRARYRIELSMK